MSSLDTSTTHVSLGDLHILLTGQKKITQKTMGDESARICWGYRRSKASVIQVIHVASLEHA
jgi:hypothetical protein